MIIDWDIKKIKEEIDKMVGAATEPRMDGYTTWGAKQDLYKVLWYAEDKLRECSTYEGENILVINPDECIDCGVCEPECPEDAILPDTDEEGAKWVEFNGKWSKEWAVLTEKKDPMPDHEKHSGEQGRLEKYFKDK